MNDLKDCPFCGGNYPQVWWTTDNKYLADCDRCKISTKEYYTKEDAIEAWNRRTPIKWPTNEEIDQAANNYAGEAKKPLHILREAGFLAGIAWIKDFLTEKDNGE